MKKATYEKTIYEASDCIQTQGKRSKIDKYLQEGYYIKEERNGFWILVKPAKIIVTLKNDEGIQSFNMKQDICALYGKQRISENTFGRFCKDALEGRIEFELGNGQYSIKRVW